MIDCKASSACQGESTARNLSIATDPTGRGQTQGDPKHTEESSRRHSKEKCRRREFV